MDNLLLKLDQTVTDILGEWDIWSTALFAIVISSFIYNVISFRDPDAHPMLLARQAQASPVRQEGESAVYRSHSAPHGIPLNSGLNIKDPGDSKWTRGRDGDLRDVWRRVIAGGQDREGKPTNEIGKLFTVMGSEQVIEHELADITRQINLIGQHIEQNGGHNIAVYLPNSIEFLAALFACAFYGLTAVLIPYDQPVEEIISMLRKSKADTVIAAVGSFPFDAISKDYPDLRQLIWVVDEGSRHMDWNEVPTGTGGAINVSTWQDVIQDQEATAGTELPALDKSVTPKPVIAFWPSGEMTEYTHANLIAGIAGQLTSVPTTQRIVHSDLFLPADSLSTIYPLVLTLAALYSNASVALNSVAGLSPDLRMATQGVAPTIICAAPATLSRTHNETRTKLTSALYSAVHWFQTRTLVQSGVMPLASAFSRMFDHMRPILGNTPGKLRLIYVGSPAGLDTSPLSAEILSDLRIYTGARIIYALTVSEVAGAVNQTGIYDYRIDNGTENENSSHFGAPVTCVEIFLRDTEELKTTEESAAGKLCVRGPAVVGGQAALSVNGMIRADHTLALL